MVRTGRFGALLVVAALCLAQTRVALAHDAATKVRAVGDSIAAAAEKKFDELVARCGEFEGVEAQSIINGTCYGCNSKGDTFKDNICRCLDGSPCKEWPLP